jgi:hypothetical protein
MSVEPQEQRWRGRLGFGIGGFGVSLVYASVGFLLLYYYTKVLGIPANIARSDRRLDCRAHADPLGEVPALSSVRGCAVVVDLRYGLHRSRPDR